MATMTSLQVATGFPSRVQEKGVFTIAGEYSLTLTLASADIIEILKIPDGVTVLELTLVHPALGLGGATEQGVTLFNIGDGDDRNRFAESHTVDAAGSFRLASQDMDTATLISLPFTYDLSDNDPDGFDTIDIEVIRSSGTGTDTGTIKLIAKCTYDYP